MGEAVDKREAVKQALLAELMKIVDEKRMYLRKEAFQIVMEPEAGGSDPAAVTLDTASDLYSGIVIDIHNETVGEMGARAEHAEKKLQSTFRSPYREGKDIIRPADGSVPDYGQDYVELTADNWMDFIAGINAIVSEENRIDPDILGPEREGR